MKAVLKVVLGCVLGIVALLVWDFCLGGFFGLLHGFFGWSVPTFTTMNLISLGIAVIALLVYRDRKARHQVKKAGP
jgi:uncharacterized membrane protein